MQKLLNKIMSADFGKLLKRWFIAALCVAVLGGGVSAALLAPQIKEGIAAVQTIQQQKDAWERDFSTQGHDREREHRQHFEAEDILRESISRPSNGAVISVAITALLGGLLTLAFWLLVAAWLYQSAVLSGMSGPMWGLLGLCGSIFAAIPFVILRGLIRKKCPSCGQWQDKKAAYCSSCGAAMREKCPDCGTECPADSAFCPFCGKKLEHIGHMDGKK